MPDQKETLLVKMSSQRFPITSNTNIATKKILLKRKNQEKIFGIVLTISHYTGMRPKEQLGLRWKDIKINQNDSKEDKKINRLIYIPADNSKTGRSREIIAPIQPQLERLKKWYSQLGIEVNENGDQYIFQDSHYQQLKKTYPQQ